MNELDKLRESNKRFFKDRGAESLQKKIKRKDENIANLIDEIRQLKERFHHLEKETTKQNKVQAAFERLKQENQRLSNVMQDMIQEHEEELAKEQNNSDV